MGSAKRKPVRRRAACANKPKDSQHVRLLEGDCLEVLGELEADSVDAIVTDPPYGLEFMGKEWDRFRMDDPGTARHRGDRAGSHGRLPSSDGAGIHPASSQVVHGGGKRPTTCRCVGCGKRDQFRKSHKPCGVGEWRKELIDPHAAPPTSLAFQEWCRTWALEAKRVLKPGGHLLAFGSTRTYHRLTCAIEDAGLEVRDSIMWLYGSGFPKSLNVQKAIAKASLEVVGWEGWGTALKPAHEAIVVARKPLIGTVAENVLEHGTGGINVDGCRIAGPAGDGNWGGSSQERPEDVFEGGWSEQRTERNAAGRWPANVVLGEEAAVELDEQTGVLRSGFMAAGTEREGIGYQGGLGNRVRHDTHGDSGGASRFFYCAKASPAERNAGLGGETERQNSHPTVKPINLMRWLCRLVTPPGGVILDPFLGSGTTGCAAVLEGFDFLGVEKLGEYMAIAETRIAFWARHEGRDVKEILRRHRKSRRKAEKRA
jgi:DNA modification methylase